MAIKYYIFKLVPKIYGDTSFKIIEIKSRYLGAAIKQLLKKSNNVLLALFQSENAVLGLKVNTKTH